MAERNQFWRGPHQHNPPYPPRHPPSGAPGQPAYRHSGPPPSTAGSDAASASTTPASGAGPPAADAPPRSIFSPRAPTDEPQRLWTNSREKDTFEDMAATFSLFTATERLENIWARRGAFSQDDYEVQCQKLIQQHAVMRRATEQSIPNLPLFIAEYKIKAGLAFPRLTAGAPATVPPPSSSGRPRDLTKFVMRSTNLFHHTSTCIELNQLDVQVLLPDVKSLVVTLERIVQLGHDLKFLPKLREWIEKLNSMPAGSRLTDQEGEQLKLDLNNGFVDFEDAFNEP